MTFKIESNGVDINKYLSDRVKTLLYDTPKSLVFDTDMQDIMSKRSSTERATRSFMTKNINDLERTLLSCMFTLDTPVKVLSKSDFMNRYNISSNIAFHSFIRFSLGISETNISDLDNCFFIELNPVDGYVEYALFDSVSAINDCNCDFFKVKYVTLSENNLFLNILCKGDKVYLEELYKYTDRSSVTLPNFSEQIKLVKSADSLYLVETPTSEINKLLGVEVKYMLVYLNKLNMMIKMVYSLENEFIYLTSDARVEIYPHRFPKIFYYGNGIDYRIKIDATLTNLSVDKLEEYAAKNLDSMVVLTHGFIIERVENYVTGESHRYYALQVSKYGDTYVLLYDETGEHYIKYINSKLANLVKNKVQ